MYSESQAATSQAYLDAYGVDIGKHAAGLNRVPYDNYAALLHEGERVLTAREARAADRGGGSTPVSIQIQEMNVRQESDIEAVADALMDRIEQAQRAGVR